jgi:hypothetical protein
MRWRRLDLPGTDEAALESLSDGFRLLGHARFSAPGGPVDLTYSLMIGLDWVTHSATVRGSTSAGWVALEIAASGERGWTLNHDPAPAVSGCIDLDLGFTPATNLLSIRRLALEVGAGAEVTAAWLPFPTCDLKPLRQVYTRKAIHQYGYSCPDLPFQTTFEVDGLGFVRDYPPIWKELG